MRTGLPRITIAVAGAGLIAAMVPAAVANAAPTPTAAVNCSWTGSNIPLDDAFARAADASGMPVDVLKAVSYLESRWDAHDGKPSGDGGYGPMNLTDRAVSQAGGKGDGTTRDTESAKTAKLGAKLTGLPVATIKSVPSANVCAGAAVLASYRGSAAAVAKSTSVNDWTKAVSRYGASGSSNEEFARQVYSTLRKGQSRTTAEGQVTLAAQPEAKLLKSGATSAPVYGRAYPEQSAYPSTIPYQTVSPLEYTMKPRQAYALTDRNVVTDYYNAKTYDGLTPAPAE